MCVSICGYWPRTSEKKMIGIARRILQAYHRRHTHTSSTSNNNNHINVTQNINRNMLDIA